MLLLFLPTSAPAPPPPPPPQPATGAHPQLLLALGLGSTPSAAEVILGTPLLPKVVLQPWDRIGALSGIEINQNQPPARNLDFVNPTNYIYQTLHLPSTIKRADVFAPEITGLQVCINVDNAVTNLVNYVFQFYAAGQWNTITQGQTLGCHATGSQVWLDIYFDKAFLVTDAFLSYQFRIGIQSSQGWWFSSPNPLPGETFNNETGKAGMFRLLTASADQGTDFLNNRYRSTVIRHSIQDLNTSNAVIDKYYLSGPQPSRFSVVNLYFDVSDADGRATVIDRILMDPVTPGVYFHVYHTNEGTPGFDNDSWEDKLWIPVNKSFKMERRQEHALPEPLATKYIKIEFSHLQPQTYTPGTHQLPTLYRKHPKWVLDYFLARSQPINTGDPYVSRTVNVLYDAFELAYSYYLDDLRQNPLQPKDTLPSSLQAFLADRTDLSDQVNADTLGRINLDLQPYQSHPGLRANGIDLLIGAFSNAVAQFNNPNNYPVERLTTNTAAITTQVSNINRDELMIEAKFPVMFFYLPCRHRYRKVKATFQDDRAYFVGVRALAFNREDYTAPFDQEVYIEGTGDAANSWRSDFAQVSGGWSVS